MNSLIRDAIREKRIVEFEYDGYHRIAEPHVYGVNGGVEQILIYQIGGGSSSGGLPNWRRVDVSRITGLRLRGETFVGPRPNPSGRHSNWDTVFEIVR